MANALLTFRGALGYVTELLSGDFDAPFGRSSHHQVWSEAMVVSPVVRGLLGVEAVATPARVLTFAPQLPADWPRAAIRRVAVADGLFDLAIERREGARTVTVTRARRVRRPCGWSWHPRSRSTRASGPSPWTAAAGPTRCGARATCSAPSSSCRPTPCPRASCSSATRERRSSCRSRDPLPGAASEGLRVLRAAAEGDALQLVLEGLPGREYVLFARTPRTLGEAAGVSVRRTEPGRFEARLRFEGPPGRYVRRTVTLPLS